jgi:flagellin
LNGLNVETSNDAEFAMKVIDYAIKKIDSMRSSLGSIQTNLQALIDNNDFASTQTSEAESRIRNVDFAKEMANFTKQQTLMQSGMQCLLRQTSYHSLYFNFSGKFKGRKSAPFV